MDFESVYGEQHSHQQAYEQVPPQGVCWCKGEVVEHLRDMIGEEGSLGATVKMLLCDREVTGSSPGSSLLQKCKVEKALKKILVPYLPSLQSSVLPPNSSSFPHLAESYASRKLRLQFKSNIPNNAIFTMTKIEAQCALFEVELLDEFGRRVEDDLRSVKIKFDVLDGDFNVEDKVVWTQKDYNENIVKPRDNKGELLKGEYKMAMSRGVVSVGHLCITDNSSHTRSRTFRLGATAEGLSSRLVIEAAVSEAFKVKERRLRSERKLKEPSPEDALCCLVGIGKKGPIYDRAQKERVFTIGDFLQRLNTDAKKLRNILNVKNDSIWNAIVKNAKACKFPEVANEGCSHHDDGINYARISYQELIYRPEDFQTGREQEHPQPPVLVPATPAPLLPSCNGYVNVGSSWYSPNADQVPECSGQSDLGQWMQELFQNSPQREEWGGVSQHSVKDTSTSKLLVACFVTKAAALFKISVQRDSSTPPKKQRLQ